MELVTIRSPGSTAAEAYRTLRTNLMFSSVDKPVSTLLVTSPARAEEKSNVLANLAVAFAQGGHSTILVDSDLRRPAQHVIWSAKNERGLTTMMLEDSALADPPLVQTGIDGLQLLPSGPLPPTPADILGGQRMGEVIGLLRARASYVLFDGPPVLAVTDAALLGSQLDGVLLVIRAGHTRREHAARAREALERVHVRIVGAVLDNAPRANVASSYAAAGQTGA
ncbi:MAG: CpsD/CapB family tyrosine-protein kinase [Anaerolineae bacterium]|nr:CpsD/CapB family tyrosine-protein kinase [Anaerolineae bacterium]